MWPRSHSPYGWPRFQRQLTHSPVTTLFPAPPPGPACSGSVGLVACPEPASCCPGAPAVRQQPGNGSGPAALAMAPTVWRWVVATAFLWRPMVRGGAAELGPYCAKGSCGYLSRCGQERQQFRWTWTASIAQGYLVWCCMRCITSTSRVCDGSDLTGRLALAEPIPVVLAPGPLQFEDLLTSGLRWDRSSLLAVNIVSFPCGALAAEFAPQ